MPNGGGPDNGGGPGDNDPNKNDVGKYKPPNDKPGLNIP